MADEKKKKVKHVLGIFEIIPEEMDGLDELMDGEVKTIVEKVGGAIETYKIEPIAFGAKKIIARILMTDEAGGTTPLETALTDSEQIQRAECTMASLI